MFVRWQTRRKTRAPRLGDLLVCKLMGSYRTTDRQPRQHVIAYLGSIRDAMPVNHRVVFWQNAIARLDELNLASDERAKVVAAIEKRVPYAAPSEWRKE